MIEVVKYNKEEWAAFSENAHRIAFSSHKPKEWDRIDFALLAVDGEVPAGYVTCREQDHETLYWQFGGSFPGTIGSTKSFRTYLHLIDSCKKTHKRITTLIENTNTVMLKMAMKAGFLIIGTRTFKGDVLLEHLLEFEK